LATVITNLMSAIPWVGQDIVEFLWGGLNSDEPQHGDVLLKILLNARIFPTFGFAYGLFLIYLIISVKIAMTWKQPAGVRSISTSEASQRLHTGDLIYTKKNKNFYTFKPIKLNPYYVTGFSHG